MLDEVVADAQTQSSLGIIAVTRNETFEDMSQCVLRDSGTCVVNRYDKLIADIVIAHHDAS